MSKSVKIILAISLMANVALVSFMAGRMFHPMPHFKEMREAQQDFAKSLPAAKQQAFLDQLKLLEEVRKSEHKGLRKQRKELFEYLASSDYSEKGFREKADALKAQERALKDKMENAVVGVANMLSEKERAAWAKTIKRSFRRPPPPHMRDMDDMPPPPRGDDMPPPPEDEE